MSSVIDSDHYITIDDVRKVVPVVDTEIEDGTLDQLIVAKSKYMVALTNREWTPTDFMWEAVQDLAARFVAVAIRERRGEMDEAEKLRMNMEPDLKSLLKSPYLNKTDTGETTGQSAIINVTSSPKSPYNNPNIPRYRSSWATKGPFNSTTT